MRIFITGATGFVGRMVVAKMAQEGHEIVACTRNITKAKAVLGSTVSFILTENSGALKEQLGTCDAVINLQGENIFGGRWTTVRKKQLRESRITFAKELSDCILSLGRNAPKVLMTASAVGYYGTNVTEPIDENAACGNDFLAHLCRDWENEALGLNKHGIRVAALRIGVVIGKNGGAMQKLLTPFKMGVGGRLGSGKQYMPWIHLSDLVSLISVALKDDRYQGPINATAPSPTTNEEFTKVLASALNRPALFPVPALALRVILGEAASVLLYGQNVTATRLLDLGFNFQFPELPMAIDEVLSKSGSSTEKSSDAELVVK